MYTPNVGDFGRYYRLNANFDMSGFSSISLVITRPDGSSITKASPDVALIATDLSTPLGPFLANQHIAYKFADGDLNAAGNYSVRLSYNAPGEHVTSDVAVFTVKP